MKWKTIQNGGASCRALRIWPASSEGKSTWPTSHAKGRRLKAGLAMSLRVPNAVCGTRAAAIQALQLHTEHRQLGSDISVSAMPKQTTFTMREGSPVSETAASRTLSQCRTPTAARRSSRSGSKEYSWHILCQVRCHGQRHRCHP